MLKIITEVIVYLYAVLFLGSNCYSYFKVNKGKTPAWLLVLNLLAGVLMLLQQVNVYSLVAGLVLMLLAGVLNGKLVLGKINWSHFLIKLLLVVLVIWLEFK